MTAIRGAICAKNTQTDISQQTVALVQGVLQANNLLFADVNALLFSVTEDINAYNPATAVRAHFGNSNVALMCFAEAKMPNSLPCCIRLCLLTDKLTQQQCVHCYMGEASALRPDLAK